VNTMNMPGFTAESSLYRTNNHYLTAGGSFSSDGHVTLAPQACGWIKGITCGVAIGGGVTLCTAACLGGGPAACYACWAGALAIVGFGFCRDCIPKWMRDLVDAFESGGGGDGGGSGGGGGGGGGGVPRRCCERNEFGRCILWVPRDAECP
jgi:hypothetical protein